MRLVRRSLVCLVVGVTAFGVAGWVFRPRPNWSVTLMTKDRGDRFNATPIIEPREDSPLWIHWDSLTDEEGRQFHLLAIDPRTGATTAHLRRSMDEPWNLKTSADGALLRIERRRPDEQVWTEIEFIPSQGEETSKLSLDGEWRVTGDGRHAWRLKPITNGFQFVQVAIPSGQVVKTLDFSGEYPFPCESVSDLSDDGRVLAFHRLDEAGKLSPVGVELWDISSGKRIRNVTLPPDRRSRVNTIPSEAASVRFLNSTLFLDVDWSEGEESRTVPRKWAAGPDDQFVNFDDLKPPFPTENPADMQEVGDATPGRRLWVATNLDSGRTEFCINGDGGQIDDWRSIPYRLVTGDVVGYTSGVGLECAFAALPGRNQSVCMTMEPTIASSLPDRLLETLPAKFRKLEMVNTRWHDWSRNEWRSVGCPSDEVLCQLRPTAYITRKYNFWQEDETTLHLQSWPLPPRDPKWPALGAAALCTVATWWVCARRYLKCTEWNGPAKCHAVPLSSRNSIVTIVA
jgi:hypothetical protein